MTRFADPGALRTIDFGPCECPGTPHASDYALVRTDLSGSEIAELLRIDEMSEEEASETLAPFVAEWNLLSADGSAAPISPSSLFMLKGPTMRALGAGIGEILRENLALPKASASPSRPSRQVRRSRSRTLTPTPGT